MAILPGQQYDCLCPYAPAHAQPSHFAWLLQVQHWARHPLQAPAPVQQLAVAAQIPCDLGALPEAQRVHWRQAVLE